VKIKVVGLLVGIGFGFTLAWARLTDPRVIHDMLLLREAHVFLTMGSAIAVGAIGVRLLRALGARAFITGATVNWVIEQPRPCHVAGSMVFALGWTVAGTCPGPVAAMIGQGQLGGLPVAAGLLAGVALQRMVVARKVVDANIRAAAAVGL